MKGSKSAGNSLGDRSAQWWTKVCRALQPGLQLLLLVDSAWRVTHQVRLLGLPLATAGWRALSRQDLCTEIQVLTKICALPVPTDHMPETYELRASAEASLVKLNRALTSTEAAFTACLIIRCNLNAWGAAVREGISESQTDNGVLFPSELLRTEFFLIMLLNVPRTAGVLCYHAPLCCPRTDSPITLSFYCNLEPVWKFYSFGKVQIVGSVFYVAVQWQWSLWLGKPHVWVQRPSQRERRWTDALEGFFMWCLLPCLLGSAGFSSTSLSSCSYPFPDHISNTICS